MSDIPRRAKPYDIRWPLTPQTLEDINSTFDDLYLASRQVATQTNATTVEVAGPPNPHNLLASPVHGDVLSHVVTAGDLLIGNATPLWAALAITVPAATYVNVLGVANGETLPSWKGLYDATVPTTIAPSAAAAAGTAVVSARRDHTHGAPAAWPSASHSLSAHTVATANLLLGSYQPEDLVIQTVADAAAVQAYPNPVAGKMLWSTADRAAYLCVSV